MFRILALYCRFGLSTVFLIELSEYRMNSSWCAMFTILDTNICLQANLSFGLQMASIIGLYLTIITHLVFSELRNLPGLNLLAMNTNMVLYQQLFLGNIHILRKQVLGLFLTVSQREHDSCTHYLQLKY